MGNKQSTKDVSKVVEPEGTERDEKEETPPRLTIRRVETIQRVDALSHSIPLVSTPATPNKKVLILSTSNETTNDLTDHDNVRDSSQNLDDEKDYSLQKAVISGYLREIEASVYNETRVAMIKILFGLFLTDEYSGLLKDDEDFRDAVIHKASELQTKLSPIEHHDTILVLQEVLNRLSVS